ncbi:SDR family NAD(P)-dependent oxidoreductase [Nonomuraea cavernae]|uniref:SDR family NAD(P)-dependent oxidoreductase n=1 Tax=Nonomuraea cavernae TaxID=2045107 RepID=UPI0033E62C29
MGVLAGKVAVVTGASRGIGAAIATLFAAEGARVVAAARTLEPGQSRLEGTLADTVAKIEADGGTAFAQPADLSRPADRQALIEAAESRYGPVDVLVNNAAVTYFTPVTDFTDRRYELMFEVQVKAPFHLSRLVAPGMRERGRGWILNISSIAARHPDFPPGPYAALGGTVYGMCKAALERFTTGLAAELYADGVAVNALSPNGIVPTPGTLFHHLTSVDAPDNEPPSVMADAALALCHRPATELTGRIAYSQDLLAELADRH